MAWWLRALIALPENPGSDPTTPNGDSQPSVIRALWDLRVLFWPLQVPGMHMVYRQNAGKILIHYFYVNKYFKICFKYLCLNYLNK